LISVHLIYFTLTMKCFNQTLSSLCFFAVVTISLSIFTPTVEAKLRSVRSRRLGQVDEPNEGRHLQSLTYVGGNPSGLTLCQGDCDEDDDCEGDLICGQRERNDPVPGCSGSIGLGSRTDFCINGPTANPPVSPSVSPFNPSVSPSASPSAVQTTTTQAPVPATTAAPVPATAAPVAATQAPVPATTIAPVPATAAPVATTQAPVPATAAPVATTQAPVPATAAPVAVTQAPAPATAAPVPTAEPLLEVLGTDPNTSVIKLLMCQGDCDEDDDCEGDLICLQRERNEAVPGCSGSEGLGSKTDFCIVDPNAPTTTTQAPVPSPPGNAPPPTTPPALEPVSLSNFRLKLYWQRGYYWQEERREREWCMRCRNNGCQQNDKLFIYACSDNAQYFDFVPVQGTNYILIKLRNKNLCFQRADKDIYMRNCNSSNQNQLWFPKRGSFNGDSFEISPKGAVNLCITQRHHPKAREEVELEPCTTARKSDTSKWNRFKN
jgi:hypothetical protein